MRAGVWRHAKRLSIALAGGLVLLVGLIAIPYPGPGWLIVFAGLAILATEFAWAQRLLDHLRSYYDTLQERLTRQPFYIKLLSLIATGILIIVTVWLTNGFGLINGWLRLDQDWLISPFLR